MIKIGSKVKVVKLIPDKYGYASTPEHAIGNTYDVVSVRNEEYGYGLTGVDSTEIVYFRKEELEIV